MSKPSPLSIAFIQRRPDVSARILESLPVEDAASLIEALPGHIGALALSEMTPFSAAQCLLLLTSDRAVLLLREMSFQDAASVYRVMSDKEQAQLADALPKDLSRDFKKALNHPTDSVGAWMDLRSSPMAQTHSVADAMKYARRKRRPAGDEIFVVDGARQFKGVVRISELVQQDGKAQLLDILDGETPFLSNRATLASVLNSPHWESHLSLPVVGRKGNFLGTISKRQIRNGLISARRKPINLAPDSIISHLFTSLIVTFVGLLGLLLKSTEPGPAVAREESK